MMTGLIVSGIVAAVGGTLGAVSWVVNNAEEIHEIERQKEYLEKQHLAQEAVLETNYKQNVKNADLKYQQTFDNAQLEYELESASLAKNKELSENTLLTNFNENKKENNYKADVADEADTRSEWLYAKELNSQLDVLRATQQSYADSFNQSQVSSGRDYGDALSAAASSGTRSSSMNTAIELDKATNSSQLMSSQKLANAEISGQYSNYLLENAKNTFALQQSRDNSNYLRNLFKEGGKEYNLYQNSLKTLNSQYLWAIDELIQKTDNTQYQALQTYTQQIKNYKADYDAQQKLLDTNYQNNQNELTNQKEKRQNGWYIALGAGSELLTGGMAGAEVGSKAYNYFTNNA
jgi:hypothetical protein